LPFKSKQKKTQDNQEISFGEEQIRRSYNKFYELEQQYPSPFKEYWIVTNQNLLHNFEEWKTKIQEYHATKNIKLTKRKCGMCCFGDTYSIRSKKGYERNLVLAMIESQNKYEISWYPRPYNSKNDYIAFKEGKQFTY
jgi:hypothetical protein